MRARTPRRLNWRWLTGVVGVTAIVAFSLWGYAFGPALWAYASYSPQEGDVIFQSLPYSPVVAAIEGGTKSPLSHCGIVAREDGRWVVYEALAPVGPTALGDFIARGRNRAFLVKRLRVDEQLHVPAMLASVRTLRGRPYDTRYRLDDERESIYCSELIWLAYQDATGGKSLGKLITLGELKWQPYERLIEQLEGAKPPLERPMITPRDLARAEQLEIAFSYGY